MRVPVLCYHRIERPPLLAPEDTNYVSPAEFGGHMRALAARGFTGVTIRDIEAWQRGELVLPRRPVAITFDDAYASVANDAMPVLTELRWPSTIFVVTSCVGQSNIWDPSAPRATIMDANALRDLHGRGHEIGSHTRNHRRVTTLAASEISGELEASRLELEAVLGAPVKSFAFPYGTHNPLVLSRVQSAGYSAACTLKRWANDRHGNSLRIGRMSVGGPISAWQLAAKLVKLYAMPSFH